MFAMRGAFDEMLQGRVKSNLRVEEVFNFLARDYSGFMNQNLYCAHVKELPGSYCVHDLKFCAMYYTVYCIGFSIRTNQQVSLQVHSAGGGESNNFLGVSAHDLLLYYVRPEGYGEVHLKQYG